MAHQRQPIVRGETVNAAARARFDSFFNDSYASVVDLLTDVFGSTTIALDEARSSVASTYRFWNKLGPRDDPLEWTLTDAFARQRRRWADHATDATSPTVGHSAAVIRRHGFTDAQLRNIIGLPETTNLATDSPVSARGPSGIAAPGLVDEKRIVVALARRRTMVATVVLTGMAVLFVAFEIFIARG